MKTLAAQGAGAVLVSGNELKMAIEAGFDPSRCVYMGVCMCGRIGPTSNVSSIG